MGLRAPTRPTAGAAYKRAPIRRDVATALAFCFGIAVSACFNLTAPHSADACADAETPPNLRATGAVAIDTLLKGSGQFPVVARRGNDVWIVFRGRGDHVDIRGRLDIIRSGDCGVTWGNRQTIVDGPSDDRNPSLGIAQDGSLVVGYAVLTGFDSTNLLDRTQARVSSFVVRSPDGGRTWSEPTALDASPSEWSSPYGRMVSVGDDLFMSMYGGHSTLAGEATGAQRRPEAFVMRSRDNGITWQREATISTGYNETALLSQGDGRFLAVMRREDDGALQLASRADVDGPWKVEGTAAIRGSIPGDLSMLGREVLLSFGERGQYPYGVRGRRSIDGGASWSQPFWIAQAHFGGDLGYPSTIAVSSWKLTAFYASIPNETGGLSPALLVARYSLP
jgi:hypothetical protein